MKKLIKILIIMCMLLQMFGCKARTEKSSGLYIEFLSTGKSDCAIIQADELNIICDTAYEWNYSQIEERLKVLGIVSIDVMILTHFDKDHIGSAGHIINEIDVETVYMPDYEEESEEYESLMLEIEKSGTKAKRLTERAEIGFANGKLIIDPPDVSKYDDDNNRSIITVIEYESVGILLAGDARKKRLEEFTDENGYGSYDLIKLPHHGDYTKSLQKILENAGTKYGIITCEASKESVEENLINALETNGAEAIYTSDGSVAFTYERGSLTKTEPK